MAGFFRHTLHPGETSLESQEKWVKGLYPAGLCAGSNRHPAWLLGWTGTHRRSVVAGDCSHPAGDRLSFLAPRFLIRIPQAVHLVNGHNSSASRGSTTYCPSFIILAQNCRCLHFISRGRSGLLWSFLLLVLIISILSTRGSDHDSCL